MILGELIKKKRGEFGISQREMAIQFGMDNSYLFRIEKGDRFPSIEFVPLIANFLGIEPEDLIRAIQEAKTLSKVSILSRIPPFLSLDKIEDIAKNDRNAYLKGMGKNHVDLPQDRDKIPKVLFGLNVIYDEILFGADNSLVYAGLFPDIFTYRDVPNVIAVSTRKVRDLNFREASEKTKCFHVLHEVGHYSLHWKNSRGKNPTQVHDKPLYCSSGEKSSAEFQANAYASSFLIPKTEVYEVLGEKRIIEMRKEGKDLCDRFYVEPWVLKYRLKRLGFRVIERF